MTAIRSICLIATTTALLLGGCGGGGTDDTPEPLGDGTRVVADSVGAPNPEARSGRAVSTEPSTAQEADAAVPEPIGYVSLPAAAGSCGEGPCPQ